MKTNLMQVIAGTVAARTVLILTKGGDYKWLFLAVFAVTSFIFGYILKKMKKSRINPTSSM